VVLLDVCGVPSIDYIFTLHDDHKLAHHFGSEWDQRSVQDGSFGVVIRPGAQYQITVVGLRSMICV
jgi:hypothetical protein